MKKPQQILAVIERRLEKTWAHAIEAEAADAARGTATAGRYWTAPIPLGKLTTADAERDFARVVTAVQQWREWSIANRVGLRWETRRLLRTSQEVPTHLVVGDLDTAARLVGAKWPERVARNRARAETLATKYPHLLPAPSSSVVADEKSVQDPDPQSRTDSDEDCPDDDDEGLTSPTSRVTARRVLTAFDKQGDLDFDLLCRAGDWFATHDGTGMTPRQVPILGLHAKWLNTRKHLVRALAGVPDLGLLPPHPPRINFTYLDPDYRAGEERWQDSATLGDRGGPAYHPRVVVISENKDTALHFPPLAGGISVEGVGKGGSTIAAFDWIAGAEHVIYWGDMDADGLEILDEFRAVGVRAVAILMDVTAYEEFVRFGTDRDVSGKPITGRPPRPVHHLSDGERQLYLNLCSPDWGQHRRIEQERLPLLTAHAAVRRLLGD